MRSRVVSAEGRDLSLFMIAGEPSGDALGGKLMAALNERRRGRVRYLGVGGAAMAAQGLVSQFPLEEVAVMGLGAIVARLPLILRRVYATVGAAVTADPNAVVIIDSPEFTHPIARRIRRRRPAIPILDYVSPSVWAWRPGRAAKMRDYVDHVLALWPFEPDAHERLGGPPCTFVGHPLTERIPGIRALDTGQLAERLALTPGTPLLVVLPGSRTSEVARLMRPFGEALALLANRGRRFTVAIPVVSSVRALIEKQLPAWPLRPHLIEGEDDKLRAFKLARAALAASGTVTLELALTGTPMVVAYKVDAVAARVLRRLIVAPSSVLPNLILRESAVPEFHQQDCTPLNLANALAPLLEDTPRRAKQVASLAKVPDALQVAGRSPSEAAADVVLDYADNGRAWPRPARA